MTLSIVILAAGQGKRMHSSTPKVLHSLAGKPLLDHVLQTTCSLAPHVTPIVIYGHEGQQVKAAFNHQNILWVQQLEQLGTGHALLQALPHIPEQHQILVLCGDVPLITTATLHRLLQTPTDEIGIVTAEVPDPTGLGRIIRNDEDKIIDIIEEKDANDTERLIHEINSGIYLLPATLLKQWLPQLQNNNAQQEYYLTDVIKNAAKAAISIHAVQADDHFELLGINNRLQLAMAERYYQHRYAENLMCQGVTLIDPYRFDIRGQLTVGRDVTIDINVIIEGHVVIGNHCTIGPNTILRNVILGDHVAIRAHSLIEGTEIGSECIIGPFARIRPGTVLNTQVHIGNFVEIKNSHIDRGSKINHLTYIGDSNIGKHVNIGAGTITCNYDGVNKHQTIIKDDVFIGSNSQLVAPVTIGEGATIGAGSTITRDAPAHCLTLSRAQQKTIENWQRPQKETIKGS